LKIKLLGLSDLLTPTVNRFTQYQISEWLSISEPFLVFVGTNDEILCFVRRFVRSYTLPCVVYPSLSLSAIWPDLLNELRANQLFSCYLYLNSFVGLERNLLQFAALMSSADKIITNSYFSCRSVQSILQSFTDIRIAVDPVRIPIPYFDICHRKKYVTVFSRPTRHKLIHSVIEACALLDFQDFTLIIGLLNDDSEESTLYSLYLTCLAKELNVPCRILRNCPPNDVNYFLQNSYVNVCLSATFEETQGKILIEAAANNCLPIANQWNGFPEFIVDHQFLVPTEYTISDGIYVSSPHLSQAIWRAINLFYTEPAIYHKLCQSIHDHYNLNTERETPDLDSILTHYQIADYPFYCQLFSHGSIEITLLDQIDYRELPLCNIELYLYLRIKYNAASVCDSQFSMDYSWLTRHANKPYSWSLLLESIAWDCLTSTKWKPDDLDKIVSFVQSSGFYQPWVGTITSLIKL